MTRPAPTVELFISGAWVNVTNQTRTEEGLITRRGRPDEASGLDPSSSQLTFNNRGGQFSPRNPTSPYYGLIGRNTPVRHSVDTGSRRQVDGSFQTPDSVPLSITGDIDLRYDAYLTRWDANFVLIRKYTTPGQLSYRMFTNATGNIVIQWSADGTTNISVASTVPLPQQSGRQAIRATLDVDNTAGGNTATFYSAPSIAGPWTQLGTPVITPVTTSIFNGTDLAGVLVPPNGAVYAAEIRNSVGTAVANPDFTAQAEGATSFADAAGNTWTATTIGVVTGRRYRFHGEIPAWPPSWTIAERDVWVSIAAAGVTRRLGQGTSPLLGPIQRAVIRATGAVAYWPAEDEDGATSVASGLPSGTPMTIAGSPRFASSVAIGASGPLPEMGLGSFTGAVPAYTATGTVQLYFVMLVPTGGATDNAILASISTTGTAARWDLRYNTIVGGSLTLDAYDSAGALLSTSGAAFAVDGKPLVVLVELVQNGANIDWKILTIALDTPLGLQWTGTLAARTVGSATTVQISPNLLLDTTVIGHIMVFSTAAPSLEQPLRGYIGEVAGRRVERLCTEEGVAFTAYGDIDDTEAMGIQRPGQLLDLLAECQVADLGILFETRHQLGLGYRTRASMYNQYPAVALTYTGYLSELAPVDDDQATRNDITVSRPEGSSARAELTTGPLSTASPPAGVGRYDETVSANVSTDAALSEQAGWRLHLGTVDEERYPLIHLNLASPRFTANPALSAAVLDLDAGDLLTISGLPAWLPPGPIAQLVQGFTETISEAAITVEFNTTPASPYVVAELDSASYARLDAVASVTDEALDATETGVDVTGEMWTTTATRPGDFPFDIVIGGEAMTVSAIVGTSSPQTMTVTRSVNGVVKTHAIGAEVHVREPVVIML